MWSGLNDFSKFYAISVQGLSGAFKECLRTARGLHRYVGPPVSTALVAGVRGMPLSLFEPALIDSFRQKMTHADVVCDSVCHKFTVRKVPLKPDVDQASPSIEPTLADVLRESRDGLPNFFPLGMHAD
jgi:hypothetical protein